MYVNQIALTILFKYSTFFVNCFSVVLINVNVKLCLLAMLHGSVDECSCCNFEQ